MALQARLPLIPPGARQIGPELALHVEGGRAIFFHAGGPIFVFDPGDAEGRRLAAAVLAGRGVALAPPRALARALGMSRSTLFEARKRYEEAGPAGLRSGKTGPKGPHKLTGSLLTRAQALVNRGSSNRGIAKELGVSEGAVRQAFARGSLRRSEPASAPEAMSQPRERDTEDRASEPGIAVRRLSERALARRGRLPEAIPEFSAAESVAKAGVLIALPVVIAQGLFAAGDQVYGRLRNGFFGLNTVLMTFVLMALLRLRTINQLPSHAPGEFGLILGMDRAPEVKTLRRKLCELAGRQAAAEFSAALTRRWSQEQPELLGFLYVDGHVRPYNGRKHDLPRTHVPRRRLCMPATTDYWVNDVFADPLFFVTAAGSEGLLATLNAEILPEVRDLVGEGRRVTLVMDRECWSPQLFQSWSQTGFDILTYRRGRYSDWPVEAFTAHVRKGKGGRSTSCQLAERPLELGNGFEVREVRCLTGDGHQTSIVTTRRDLPILEVAERMFARWRQENFFRYMRHEFALDHLSTYAVELADTGRLVPNPAKKQKQKDLASLRSSLGKLRQAFGDLAIRLPAEVLVGDPEAGRLLAEIAEMEAQITGLRAEARCLPKHVAIGTLMEPGNIVRLERERKRIVDSIKMVAYRAETELASLAGPLLGTFHDDEARSFLRQVFALSAALVPDPDTGVLNVRFHGMSNPRSNRALAGLCSIVNSYETTYPGTRLRLVFHAPETRK
jgi:transposase